jgi:hypothetical protein
MPRKLKSTKELRDAAAHVGYEIEMLRFSAEHLGGWHSSPFASPVGNEKNMALESFLLHFRNLRAFLCPSLQGSRDDDVLASDFLGKYDGSDVGDRDVLKVDKERLDKMLAHISYTRPDYIEAGEHGWDGSRMSILLLSELQKFLGLLTHEKRAWFPSADALKSFQEWAQWEIDHRPSSPPTK